ncbi:MAG TPA: nuclear transport factor 2 family protein [Actinomycetes bacterium]|jgi:hypothetical protein|nr:nuclear transport factor 2 family protein [Actinomycetes bacterium]
MIQPHPFRRALEARDTEAMVATLSPDVVFHGPAVGRSIVGRAEVSRLLQAVVASFQAFTQEFRDGPRTALVFQARIRDRVVQGVSLLEDDEHGRIKTITVMTRPLSGPTARGDAVRAQRAQPRAGSITPPAASRTTPAWAAAGRSPRRDDRPTDRSRPW